MSDEMAVAVGADDEGQTSKKVQQLEKIEFGTASTDKASLPVRARSAAVLSQMLEK